MNCLKSALIPRISRPAANPKRYPSSGLSSASCQKSSDPSKAVPAKSSDEEAGSPAKALADQLAERPKHRPADCRRRGSLSIALVGGGRALAYAAILLKQNPAIKEIRLVDADDSLAGSVCDIRHIDTSAQVKHYRRASILEGVRNCDVVGLMDETDFELGGQGPLTQFAWSAEYVRGVAECLMTACPRALVAVFARPVTACLPLVCELFRHSADWQPNRIIGSAALESMRMAALTADYLNLEPGCLLVPMAGGADARTTVPLLSRARPFNDFSAEEHCELVGQLRRADRDLSESEVKGPTLSSGVAAAKFISSLINGLREESISIASAYVRSDVLPGCKYTTSEIQFGPQGLNKNYGLPKVSARELDLLEQAAPLVNRMEEAAKLFLATGRVK